jgi:sortase A
MSKTVVSVAEPGAEPGPGRADKEVDRTRTARPPREPLSPGRRAALWVLACLGGLAVWFVLYALVLSALQESRDQTVLYAQLRQELAEATAPIGGQIEPGVPVYLLSAPTAGLTDMIVVEGTTSADLTEGPGHRSDTPLPGQPGVSVVLGRSVMFGAPFRSVTEMKPGDTITVTTGQGEFTYTVDRVRRPGDPLPPPIAANQSRLVLVSTVGAGWRTGWAPQHTVYVDASLTKGKIQPYPVGRPAAVPESQLPMQGDPSALVTLVLWLQALLLVVLAAVWARARWGGWQTWLVALPIVLACLWGATQTVVVLLPNLI